MRKRRFFLILTSVFFISLSFFNLSNVDNVAYAQVDQNSTDEVLVKFRPFVPEVIRNQIVNGAQDRIGGSITKSGRHEIEQELGKIGVLSFHVASSKAFAAADIFSHNLLVEYAEPNYQAEKLSTTNDPSLSDQWGLFKVQSAKADGESAWDIAKGVASVKVAVLDTGIDNEHPDVSSVVVLQRDFTGSPFGTDDRDGHGTHIAGSIGAIGNNGIGVAGVAYGVSLLDGKVLSDNGYGTYAGIASGITWAADNGAKVINLSLGGTANSQTLNNAVDYAIAKGAVVVAAAGNSGTSGKFYPAGYGPVVSVAATDKDDKKPSWSNFGSWVDIAAPGYFILSTTKDNQYVYYSGTSMATSYVSGAMALTWSDGSCSSANCVINRVFSSADKIVGTGSQFANGRINTYKAAQNGQAQPTVTPSVTPTATNTPTPTPTPPADTTPTVTLSPSSTPTPTNIMTPSSTPTPTPTQSQSQEMTVSAIEMSYVKRFGFINDISTKITVSDPVKGHKITQALVEVILRSPSGISYFGSGQTNSNGQITFVNKNNLETGNYKSTIVRVSKNGFTYIPTLIIKTLKVL